MPVKVAVPAVAENAPLTSSDWDIEKPEEAITLPVTWRELNKIVPPPPIVFVVPFIKILPGLLLVKEPVTEIFPVTGIEDEELTVPVIVKLSNVIFVPLIVFAVPLMVSVPPGKCVKVPGLVVERLPFTEMLLVAEAVILLPAIIRL